MKKTALAAAIGGAALLCSMAAPAMAEKSAGDILARARIVLVQPDESSKLSLGNTAIPGHVALDSSIIPELDFSYFFTDNIAAELILGTTQHHPKAQATPLGASVDLGDVWLLPPTLTLQYHFNPKGTVSPYVGAGINYTIFYGEDPGAALDTKYDNGFGYALQAGVDFALTEKWSFNVDVKKLWLNTNVKVNAGLPSLIKADVDIDPWLIGVGFGYRF
ncbi:OmpW/AlkL family protein [Niveispirillum irakense]|uniref:OmpW/AlkL family protein n=1 Tax=Niveispirillum irakense TaxID=34011 RepID=UPI00048E1BD1|nr:OmpW family outer membrane protein [Niveispirillum irakense]